MSVTSSRVRVLWFWIGLGLCAVFIYGCLTPNPPSGPAGVPQFDKFEHAFAFFVMGAWFGALFRYAQLRVLIVLSLFGAVMEVVQWSIGYRDGDPWDWVADAAGIVIGLSFLWLTGVDWVARVEHLVKATGN